MLSTKKQKTRFKVRIFDLKSDRNTSFSVYEDCDDKMTLKQFKRRLEGKSNIGDK